MNHVLHFTDFIQECQELIVRNVRKNRIITKRFVSATLIVIYYNLLYNNMLHNHYTERTQGHSLSFYRKIIEKLTKRHVFYLYLFMEPIIIIDYAIKNNA